jgi:Fur family peroxide stress response transcriptional regulator
MKEENPVVRYKRSRQRERILETLRGTKSHPTATWVYDELKREFPDLSLGTVYRNLGILRDQGLVRVLQSGSTFDRFDADTAAHYHFICEKCGRVDDVPMAAMDDLDRKASDAIGCSVSGHRIDFYGVCADCSQRLAV